MFLLDFRGIADDRSKPSESAYFAANGHKIENAPRKLKAGDVIAITVDLNSGSLEINVNSGEFRHRFTTSPLPQGSPRDFWFGATFGENEVEVVFICLLIIWLQRTITS